MIAPPGSEADPLALWYTGQGQAELRPVRLAEPCSDSVTVETVVSGISRGTESLIWQNRVPPSEYGRMAAPFQDGAFPYPVKYGYCAVGRIVAGPPDRIGEMIFALHPHQQRFIIPSHATVTIPDGVPASRAVLAANLETALNAVWDSGAGPCDRIAIVGGGVIGLLTAWLAARILGTETILAEPNPARRAVAAQLGLTAVAPDALPGDQDIVIHASATTEGLATAINAAGEEATVIELSWYGSGTTAAQLGGSFHSRRLTLRASQVGAVSASRRVRWSHRRRLEAALGLLRASDLDVLLEPAIAFSHLPQHLNAILGPGAARLCQVVRYL